MATPPRRRGRIARAGRLLAVVVVLYLALAYVVLPALWIHHERLPALATLPMVTRNGDDIPCDPVNVGLVGTREEVIAALAAANWRPADPITLRSSIGIVTSVLLDRPDLQAPVSTLYLFGRPQDLAFEQELGASARQRHHVRFWEAPSRGPDGRPLWLGAATFDRGVGLSHRTGQVTHHIGSDVDAERAYLIDALGRAGRLESVFQETGRGPTALAWNGGGDRYFTDGEIWVGVLLPRDAPGRPAPVRAPAPPAVQVKDRLFGWLR